MIHNSLRITLAVVVSSALMRPAWKPSPLVVPQVVCSVPKAPNSFIQDLWICAGLHCKCFPRYKLT